MNISICINHRRPHVNLKKKSTPILYTIVIVYSIGVDLIYWGRVWHEWGVCTLGISKNKTTS